jgi:hypothetical protein
MAINAVIVKVDNDLIRNARHHEGLANIRILLAQATKERGEPFSEASYR